MQPLGVHHVSINVRDATESLAFYTDVLGLTPRTDRPDFSFGGAWLDVGGQEGGQQDGQEGGQQGGQQLHLIEGDVPDGLGQHFAIRVADLDAVVDELRDRGIEVRDPKPVGTARQTFVLDPSGNMIELHQPAM